MMMTTAIPGDWKVNDDEGKALPDEETMKRLEENIAANREAHPELIPFLQRLQCIINVQADALMKSIASNRSLTLKNEDARHDHSSDQREIKNLTAELKKAKDKIAAMEKPVDLLPEPEELPVVAEDPEAPAPTSWADTATVIEGGATNQEAAPSDFDGPTEERLRHEASLGGVLAEQAREHQETVAKELELAAFVIELARKHGMEPEELCFTVDSNSRFTVHNTVPRAGRRRSASDTSFSGAVQSLSVELAAS